MKQKRATRAEGLLRLLKRHFGWLMLLLIAAVFLSGVFLVRSDEVAVVLRFGKLVGDTEEEQILQPGLHFAFPYLVDEVIHVPVGKVQQLSISTHTSLNRVISSSVSGSGYVLTGDHNIVMINATVKYRINDPVAYALTNAAPETMVESAVSSELFRLISGMDVDTLLTTGKESLALTVQDDAQFVLDNSGCGILLTGVELTEIAPPYALQAAFDAVNAASVEKQTAIQQANEYRQAVIPDAQSQAQQLIDNATSDQTLKVSGAHQEIASFTGLLEQYELAPESVLNTVVRQRMLALLQRMSVYVVPEGQLPPRIILP